MAGFRATPSRRNPVLYGMVVHAIRFKNPLLHRQSTLRKRRLGENRVSGQTSRAPAVGGRNSIPSKLRGSLPACRKGSLRSLRLYRRRFRAEGLTPLSCWIPNKLVCRPDADRKCSSCRSGWRRTARSPAARLARHNLLPNRRRRHRDAGRRCVLHHC